MKNKRIFLVFILFLVSQASHGQCSQTNNVLSGLVGLDGGTNKVYAGVQSQKNECSCSLFRFKADTGIGVDTNMALSILLSAKLADKKVRVDILDPEDCNSAYRVYVE